MPWPLPALLTWAIAWAVYLGLRSLDVPAFMALLCGAVIGALPAVGSPWPLTARRRCFMALGFPLSLAASGIAGDLPAWAWLLPLGALALLYPLNAWRDAPFFPTPHGALRGLARLVRLPEAARVLEAGCGLGDGLRELHAEYPRARLDGVEWSWPLRAACQWRCRFAQVIRGDLWKTGWSGYQLVYLFQRPESMPRAVDKAARELTPGAWLASLDFEALPLEPDACHACPDGRRVWLYQQPFTPRREKVPGTNRGC
jgi:SAM-dependent methyltransferase